MTELRADHEHRLESSVVTWGGVGFTRDKCSYADRYKVIRKPTCGCRVCNEKWDAKNASAGDNKDD